MDQSQLAGVGNYLKVDALYSANIDQLLTVGELEVEQLWFLNLELQEIAQRSYSNHGASFHSYLGPKGKRVPMASVFRSGA